MNVFVFVMKSRLEYSELCKIDQVVKVKFFIVWAYNFDTIDTIKHKSCWMNKVLSEKRSFLNKKVKLKII